jgi:hypothetical protein
MAKAKEDVIDPIKRSLSVTQNTHQITEPIFCEILSQRALFHTEEAISGRSGARKDTSAHNARKGCGMKLKFPIISIQPVV